MFATCGNTKGGLLYESQPSTNFIKEIGEVRISFLNECKSPDLLISLLKSLASKISGLSDAYIN
jgi:hypothetical protein